MRLGLIGLEGAGKRTIMEALVGARGTAHGPSKGRSEAQIAVVNVPDERLEALAKMFRPEKVTHARVEYLLAFRTPDRASDAEWWNQIRTCDALLHVLRNFPSPGGEPPRPEEDFWRLEEEMILGDLGVVEKRLERMEMDRRKGKVPAAQEPDLLKACKAVLEEGRALRTEPDLAENQLLRGFALLSAKPQVVVVNNEEEDLSKPSWTRPPDSVQMVVVRGRLERDLTALGEEEAEQFREAYQIDESVLDRVIAVSYKALRRISFFTVISNEVRSWSVAEGTVAHEAAGAVHSDMKKGFIRAEVVPFTELMDHGSLQEARKAGRVRLEGKEYVVQDGDVISFRFSI